MRITPLIVSFGVILSAAFVSGYVEALAANIDTGLGHFQPMVAILCGHGKYHSQYLDKNKRWISDPDPKALCTKDKLEILEYCRKVYPKKDIRNIVDSNKYYRIDNWCKLGQKKCKAKHYVKPYRCLEGPFQSDALLVPEHCLFDHVHNQSLCQSPQYWNRTASRSCGKKSLELQSYAMLLPCGVGIFSGVEFVCCPRQRATTTYIPPPTPQSNLHSSLAMSKSKSLSSDESNENVSSKKHESEEDNDDDDDDDYDEDGDYYDDYENDEPITTTTTERPIDHYLSHFDSTHEHDSFKAAQRSLEENHRDKVTKVMKQWSELEEHYQEMKRKDPKAAENFKKKMTAKFQKTVEALEEEGSAEKRQLISMHQQRVMTIINMRKKDAMDCYTKSLELVPMKTKRIEKCLERLLRALEKDRQHTLHHFRHLLNSNTKQALREKESMLEHLDNLIRMGNQSIQMLERAPSMSMKMKRRMIGFWHNLKGIALDKTISKADERAIMEKYEEEVARKQQNKERQRMQEEERRQEMVELQEEKKRLEEKQKNGKLEREFDPESMEDEQSSSDDSSKAGPSDSDEVRVKLSTITPSHATSSHDGILAGHDNFEQNAIHEILPTPKISHIHSQSFHHNEVTYSMHREPYNQRVKWNGSVYVTLAFAGLALLTATIVGVVLLRRHARKSPHSQGFVEVDQTASPEERHVANMQINGYENPTYKYFEAQTA